MSQSKDKFGEFFDEEHREYVSEIMDAEAEYYEKAAILINNDLPDWGGVVLDIGNGGIINYDYKKLKKLLCADIYVSEKIKQTYRNMPNIEFTETDITNMKNIKSNVYDAVIVQKVIHHLAVPSYSETKKNAVRALRECMRVLKPSGKLIICESTVSRWFELLEIFFFPLMLKMCDFIKFDRVYQYSPKSLERLIRSGLKGKVEIEKMQDIGMGKYVLFLGRKLPARILPCSVTYYSLRKKTNQ